MRDRLGRPPALLMVPMLAVFVVVEAVRRFRELEDRYMPED